MKGSYFTLLLFCIFCNINFVFSQEGSENHTYPNGDSVGYYVISVVSLILMHLNLLGNP